MNKSYRIVWSKARAGYIVTHEKAASRGRPSSTCTALAAAALLALGSTSALAANLCHTGSNTINTSNPINDYCALGTSGDSVTIDNGGTIYIIDTFPPAIWVSGAADSITIRQGGTVRAGGDSAISINAGSTLSGSIVNSGNLSSVNASVTKDEAILVKQSTIVGSIINDNGQINNSVTLDASSVSTIENINGGQISATVTGNTATGLRIKNGSSISGRILNGTGSSIHGSASGVLLQDSTVGTGGIVNQGSITGGTTALDIKGSTTTINGNILNSGTIEGTGTTSGGFGIYLTAGTLNGSIVNESTGLIKGKSVGITLYMGAKVTGGLVNRGEVRGVDGPAIRIFNNALLEGGINNSGTIASDYSYGAGLTVSSNSRVTDGLRNTGTISGKVFGMVFDTGGTLSAGVDDIALYNNNKIQGGNTGAVGEVGIRVYGGVVNGNLVNEGTISGTAAVSVENAGKFNGKIHNTGTISGKRRGILVDGSNSALTAGADGIAIYNSNSILAGSVAGGTDESAIYVGNGAQVTGHIVNDGGTMGGGKFGVLVNGTSQINGNISNGGTISGTKYAVQVADTATLNGLVAKGNAARFIGDVYAKNTDFTVASGAVFANDNAYDVKGVIVENGAQFTLKAGTNTSGMANGITVGDDGFVNAGTVKVDAGTIAAAIHGSYTQTGTGVLQIGSNGGAAAKLTVSGAATTAGNVTLAANAALLVDKLDNSGTLALGNGSSVVASNGVSNSGKLILGAGSSATVQGNYTQAASGALQIGVNDDTTYAKLAVNGAADLGSNAQIDIDVTQKGHVFNVKRLENVITATTLNSDGTFKVTDNSELFNFGAVKEGNAVHLTLEAAAGTGGGTGGGTGTGTGTGGGTPPAPTPGPTVLGSVQATGNLPGTGAAVVLDQLIAANPSGTIPSMFVGLTNRQEVSQAVTQTLPLLNGGSMAAATGSIAGINRVVQARIEANRGLSSGDEFLGDKYVWFKPFGSWAKQDDRDGVAGFKASTGSFVLGADAATNGRARFGAGFAYASSRVNGNSAIAPQHLDVDVFQLLGYGSVSLDERTELNFQADVGQNRNKGSRSIAFTGSTAHADYRSLTAHAGVGVGHVLPLNGKTAFTPSVRMDYIWIRDQSYQETGADALNLNVNSRSARELLLSLDGKLTHNLDDQTTLTANVGAAYDALNNGTTIVAAYAGAPEAAFATYGTDKTPWSVRGGLGLTRKTAGGTEITLRYDAEGRSGFLNQTASLKARWAF
ncbi:autotransporter domain-containing protein [Noviherbaspirillum cavernae]|uniref:Autotransporter domain-containing protein n=1 Tax=Noviherbaspirillum cavernae TaxID=2320862 RepID=A0A418WYJ9_9BURK|nr:autotransporter domain-containing protein [Noviherbaspirillum cavernae]RJG05296.1 autotransporter domain-containing protein [Noviherbaspirillum cavernae]